MTGKLIVQVFGVILLLVGLLGFVNNPVLGIFAVDPLHNIIHLATGVVGLYMATAMGDSGAMMFGKVFAVVYGLVTILGFIMMPSILGLVTVNMADNFLHLALTAVFAYVGFMPMKKMA